MNMQRLFLAFFCLSLLISLSACGGSTEPVNEGKDRPIPLKKAQEKDK